MPLDEKVASYVAKRLGRQTDRSRLKKIVIDVVDQKLVGIYERGMDRTGNFESISEPDVHISLTPDDLPAAGLTKIKDFVDAYHNYIVAQDLL